LKVLYIITKAAEIGGAQIHVRDLSRKLQTVGSLPTVITGEYGALTDQLSENGIQFYVVKELKREINIFSDFIAILKVATLIRQIKPNVISLHSSKAGLVGRLACFLNFRRAIFTAHGWSFADGISPTKKMLYIYIEKFLMVFTSKVITVSEQDKRLAMKHGVAGEAKQIAIHNGMPFFKELARKTPSNIFKFVMVARFSEQKDHKTLFKALSELPKNIAWELDLIGGGPLEIETRELAISLGLEDKIHFLGQVENVSEKLFNYDLFLLVSKWEGFPRSILEAMRTGLPVIASDVGGVSEALVDQKGGILVPRGDSSELKNAIVYLTAEINIMKSMGEFNKQRFNENFTFDVMFKKTFSIYRSVFKQ